MVGDTGRTERLRRILDQRHVQRGERVEGGGPAEEVHGQQRTRARRDLRRDVFRIDVERHRVDVGEDRRRAALRDRLRGRIEREGRADHLVAGADLERVQREDEGVRAVRDADRPAHAEIGGGFGLEGPILRPAHELLAVENLAEPQLELGDQRLVLGMNVNERDRHGGSL